MVVARLHKDLFEATALELDRQIRAQFVDESLRPPYLKDFQSQLREMIRIHEAGAGIRGRLGRFKRVVRRLLRPYLVHQHVINRMTMDRLSDLHDGLTRLVAASEESHAALRADLEYRADGLRAALLEEFRRWAQEGTSARRAHPAGPDAPTIPAGSRLVLGTVTMRRPGYIHVDPTGDGPAHLSAPLDRLPATPGTVAEVVVANVLEQFTAAEVRGRLLPHWASLLQPGGRLILIATDVEAAADRFRDGQIGLDELTGVLFGAGGPIRRSAYTPELLRRYAAEAGLTDVSVTYRGQRREANAYGFELTATRPAA